MKPEKIHLGVYGIVEKNKKLLVIKKNRGPYKGLFDLPGGRIEPGENINEALVREFKEEVGLDIVESKFHSIEEYHCEWTSNDIKKYFHHIAIIFLVIIQDGILKENPDGHDSDGACWIKKTITKEELSPIVKKIFNTII